MCFDSGDGLLRGLSWQTAVTIVRDSSAVAYGGAFWTASSPLYDNGNAVSHAFYSTPVDKIRITVDGQTRTFDTDGTNRTLRELVNGASSVASGDRSEWFQLVDEVGCEPLDGIGFNVNAQGDPSSSRARIGWSASSSDCDDFHDIAYGAGLTAFGADGSAAGRVQWTRTGTSSSFRRVLVEVFGHTATPPASFTCSCADGFRRITEYTAQCAVTESVASDDWSGNCDIDVDECASNPCQNGGTCVESSCATSSFPGGSLCDPESQGLPSLDRYRCECAAGYSNGVCADGWDQTLEFADLYDSTCAVSTGGHCDIDINECISLPCENGAVCRDSTTNSADVGMDEFQCVCAPGFAAGVCEYDFLASYADDCAMVVNTTCNIDVNECDSNPCQNGATCQDSSTDPSVPPNAYRCTCAAGFVNGVCDSDLTEYATQCNVLLNGNCDVDVDECISSPCQNGAVCSDSRSDPAVPANQFSCKCGPGLANGICDYDFSPAYALECNLATGAVCRTDLSECASSPCQNGGICSQSQRRGAGAPAEPAVSGDAYQCTRAPGFANGLCGYNFIPEYYTECTVAESTASADLGANCDVDVNECDSNPCHNGAACIESSDDDNANPEVPVSPNAYRCLCAPGFASGVCQYSFMSSYSDLCSVQESGGTWAGNCEVDVDECNSNPCQNGASCVDSSTDLSVPSDAYRCMCTTGYASGACAYDFIDEYSDQCNIMDSAGGSGGNCDVDVNECDSGPCQNSASCSDSTVETSISVGSYQCVCGTGFANGQCGYTPLPSFAVECSVLESTFSLALSGNCDIGERAVPAEAP